MSAKGHIDGMVAPRVFIYNNKGEPIVNRFDREIGRETVRFEYSYDEEDDDRCTITFQTSDVQLPDLVALKRDRLLIVRWGFVNSDGELIASPQRLVAIRDRETEYNNNKITLTLKCTDNISYLKKRQIDSTRENDFIGWLNEIIEGKHSATLIISGQEHLTYNDTEQSSYDVTKRGQITMAVDNTAAPNTEFFETKRVIKGNSQAISQAIEHELQFAKGGPYFVDGRDNTLTIHNRDFNQKNSRTFYYNTERGDIIKFKFKTNIEKNEITQNRIANLEPGSRGVFSEIKDIIRVSDLTNDYDPITSNSEIDRTAIQDYLANLKEQFEGEKRTGGVYSITEDDYNNGDFDIIEDFQYNEIKVEHLNDRKASDLIDNTLLYTEAVDHTAAPFDYIEEIDIQIGAEQILSSPVAQTELGNMMENEALYREHRKYMADIQVIGDPSLTSSRLIKVVGVAKVHAGSYYTVKVTHRLSFESGYVTSMETIRKPSEVAVASNKFTTKLKSSKFLYDPKKDILSDNQREVLYDFYHSIGKDPILDGGSDQSMYTNAVEMGLPAEKRYQFDTNNDGIPERKAEEDIPVNSSGNITPGQQLAIDILNEPIPNSINF